MHFLSTSLLLTSIAAVVSAQIPSQYTSSFDRSTTLSLNFGQGSITAGEKLPLSDIRTTPQFTVSPRPTSNQEILTVLGLSIRKRDNSTTAIFLSSPLNSTDNDDNDDNDDDDNDNDNDNDDLPWKAPAPPEGDGEYSYVFLLYRNREDADEPDSNRRKDFDIAAWQREEGLQDPVAGTWFRAESGDRGAMPALATGASTTTGSASSGRPTSTATKTVVGADGSTVTVQADAGSVTTGASTGAAARNGGNAVVVVGIAAAAAMMMLL